MIQNTSQPPDELLDAVEVIAHIKERFLEEVCSLLNTHKLSMDSHIRVEDRRREYSVSTTVVVFLIFTTGQDGVRSVSRYVGGNWEEKVSTILREFCKPGQNILSVQQDLYCIRCWSAVHVGDPLCGECGASLMGALASCPNCGAEQPSGAKYCARCGQILAGLRMSPSHGVGQRDESSSAANDVEHHPSSGPTRLQGNMQRTSVRCVYHPEREATGACVECGRFICVECVVDREGRAVCRQCLAKDREIKDLRRRILSSRNTALALVAVLPWVGAVVTVGLRGSEAGDELSPALVIGVGVLIMLGTVVFPVAWLIRWRIKSERLATRIRDLSSGKASPAASTSILPLSQAVSAGTSAKDTALRGAIAVSGSAISMIFGVIVGFIAMVFLAILPIVGPILGGFIAGIIAGHGAGRGLITGFLAGMLGSIIAAALINSGFAFFGNVLDLPVIGSWLGGAFGTVVIVLGLYTGFLGMIGGAIGGALRNPKKHVEQS